MSTRYNRSGQSRQNQETTKRTRNRKPQKEGEKAQAENLQKSSTPNRKNLQKPPKKRNNLQKSPSKEQIQGKESSTTKSLLNRVQETTKRIKIWSTTEASIVRKDLMQTWHYRGVRTLIIVIPLTLMVFIPLIFFVVVMLMQDQSANVIARDLLATLSDDYLVMDFRQQSFALFTELLCPLLLIIIAIISSVCCASCSFVLERDKFTLETLLLSPLNNKSIYHAKLSGSVIMSLIISLISFLCYMFLMIVANIMLSMQLFFTFEWLFLLLLLLPAVILFCTIFISLLAPRLKSVGESFQLMGYIILIFVLIYFLQFLGVFHINTLFVFLMAVLFFVADLILYNYGLKKFTPENWLTDNFLKLKKPKDHIA